MSYSDIVGIVQGLASGQMVAAAYGQQSRPATFVLQDMPASLDPLYNVPVIGDTRAGRRSRRSVRR